MLTRVMYKRRSAAISNQKCLKNIDGKNVSRNQTPSSQDITYVSELQFQVDNIKVDLKYANLASQWETFD